MLRAVYGVKSPLVACWRQGSRVLEWLRRASEKHWAPKYLRSDNGPDFIARVALVTINSLTTGAGELPSVVQFGNGQGHYLQK